MTIDARILVIKDKKEQDAQLMKTLSMVNVNLIPLCIKYSFLNYRMNQVASAVRVFTRLV